MAAVEASVPKHGGSSSFASNLYQRPRSWRVVGGTESGGLLVRLGSSLSSEKEEDRLSTGSIVEALEHDEVSCRLRYRLLEGSGPPTGWISTRLPQRGGARELLEEVPRKSMDTVQATSKAHGAAPASSQLQQWQKFLDRRKQPSASQQEQMPFAQQQQQQQQQQGSEWVTEAPPYAWQEAPTCWDGYDRPQRKAPFQAPPRAAAVSANNARASLQKHLAELTLFQLEHQQSSMTPSQQQPPPHLPVQPCSASKPFKVASASEWLLPSSHNWAPRSSPSPASGRDAVAPACGYGGLAELAPAGGPQQWPGNAKGAASGGGGEIMCYSCSLPLGEVIYPADFKEGAFVHGECKAQACLEHSRIDDSKRLQKEAAITQERRARYQLGWKPKSIPRNSDLISSFAGKNPQMVCFAMDPESKSLSLVPTSDPNAAVNLSYLACALHLRETEGREAIFSLDPVLESKEQLTAKAELWQQKRFEPSWLAGTALGEVLFQADYHLKELSMGVAEQPVLGMKSCIEIDGGPGLGEEWTAREWFVVKDAEVFLSEGNMVVPHAVLGVEAKEQLLGPDGLDDAPITRPDHPLVKYAEQFSKNFELIAARRSVFHNLREVAKASVLAKFLCESGANFDRSWFEGIREELLAACSFNNSSSSSSSTKSETASASALDGHGPPLVPLLRAERRHSSIQLQNGKINGWEDGLGSRLHVVSGGVQMGLEHYPLQELVVAPSRISRAERQPKPPGFEVSRSFVQGLTAGLPDPQGVDLSLSSFNLSELTKSSCDRVEEHLVAGSTFWKLLEAGQFGEAGDFWRRVFDQALSDRRDEEELFLPPGNSADFLLNLKALLEEETTFQHQRLAHFASEAFDERCPGRFFPASWAQTINLEKVSGSQARSKASDGLQKVEPTEDLLNLDRVLSSKVLPSLDKSTEDGHRFRVFHWGKFVVRTVEEPKRAQRVVAVLEKKDTPGSMLGQPLPDSSLAANITEYVELGEGNTGNSDFFNHFLVVDTSCGGTLEVELQRHRSPGAAERNSSGTQAPAATATAAFTWLENSRRLPQRRSCAKVLRTIALGTAPLTVKHVRELLDIQESAISSTETQRAWKRFVEVVFARAASTEE